MLVLICMYGKAQKPEDLLSQWAEKSPIEKVYLHLDRDNYIAGEIAWFKAYLSSDYLPDTISTVLYVELINSSSNIISRKILPVLLGSTNGQLELPDSLYTGTYLLRAYNPSMLNNGADHIFRKPIFIYGKKKTAIAKQTLKNVTLVFFPEGGNMVTGFTNTIAFKATDEYGMPVTVSGKILNEKNETKATFTSYHAGMGMFELTPNSNEKYHAETDDGKKYDLPSSVENGISLTIIPHPEGYYFEIKQKKHDHSFRAAYLLGQMQHHVVFKQTLNGTKDELQGVINTTKTNSGILQVTVFNKDGVPLAERLCFVNNKEYIQAAELRLDTVNFNEKGKNNFKILMKDTVQGSFSVSITDADYQLIGQRQRSIISELLLSSDLKGYIHDPAWYFRNEDDSTRTALDLLMMTNGWRRFRWDELAQKIKDPVPNINPSYISIEGKINLRGTNKAFAEKNLMAIITAEGMGKNMQLLTTDKQGNFKLDSLLFFGKARILFIDTRGKKGQYIDVVTKNDSLEKPYKIEYGKDWSYSAMEITATESDLKMNADYDAIQKAAGLLLEEVKVKAIKKTPTEILDEEYTRGMFGGFSDKTIDLVNTDQLITDVSIFDYLISRVTGLDFAQDGANFTIYYRQAPTASSMGLIPMIIYLNEVETDASVVASIPPNEIALIKVYSHFVGASGNAAGGALSIYTKKGSDIATSSRGDVITYKGFSVVKEFYAPDYKKDESALFKPDNRITLAWRPNIFVNNINPVIPVSFYNSDRSKKFRVVVEGMTTSGKLVSLEKIITPIQK